MQINGYFKLFMAGLVFMFGVWTMEVGSIGMMNNLNPTNGWMSFNAWQVYHFGLYLQIISFVVVGYWLSKSESENKNDKN